ncbi:FAD-dependent monooxygenase [Verrucomicrobiaceae bacterium 227]
MKEITIAGGGLAGLSLGIALSRRGVPVVIREAGSYPRHRVCGEFINGVTHETLVKLGIDSLFRDALRHEWTGWWMGSTKILEARLPTPALGMSRWKMDERLRVEFENSGGELRTNDRARRVPAAGLVWTAGRRLDKESSLLGLKAHFEGVELGGALEMHLGEGSYVGLTPIMADGSRVNVCGLFRSYSHVKGGNSLIEALRKSGLEDLADRLASARMDPKSLTGISGIGLGRQQVDEGLCSLGDAERMIPPFTGNGMSMAFESAECALEPLLAFANDKLKWERTRIEIAKALEERFRSRVRLALVLHRCLMSKAGRVTLSAAARAGVLPFAWLHRRLS